jgi:hypothetical protein
MVPPVLRDTLPPGVPDGTLGMVGVLVACSAGAAVAIAAGADKTGSLIVAAVVAIAGAIVVKVRADMRTARSVTAIARGEIPAEAAPLRVQARLASRRHRQGLAGALRRSAGDAARYPRRRLISPPPLVLHFEPETRERLLHLAELIESDEHLPARGVAMTEEFVTNPASPLFGEGTDREVDVELRRVLFSLGSD